MAKKNNLIGKTIESVEVIKAEYGRTYDYYSCIVFTDKSKALINGDMLSVPWNPSPNIEEMKKAPNFFSAEDIANKVLKIEQERRKVKEKEKEEKERQLNRLKKELGYA